MLLDIFIYVVCFAIEYANFLGSSTMCPWVLANNKHTIVSECLNTRNP